MVYAVTMWYLETLPGAPTCERHCVSVDLNTKPLKTDDSRKSVHAVLRESSVG